MRSNFDDIKNKIKTINQNDNSIACDTNRDSVDSFNQLDNESLRLKSSMNKKFRETEREKNLDNKLEEINVLGERLYEKLVEKVN
jgi:hypothetical protein